MPASFFSRQMALHAFVLIWRKGYLTPLYLCLFFFLFTNLFLQIHSIFPPFLKEKNRNKEKYKGFGRHHSIPSVKLKSYIAICLLKKLAGMTVYQFKNFFSPNPKAYTQGPCCNMGNSYPPQTLSSFLWVPSKRIVDTPLMLAADLRRMFPET